MSITIDRNTINGSDNFISHQFKNPPDQIDLIYSYQTEESISNVMDNYINLINQNQNIAKSAKYRENLKRSFLEYLETNKTSYSDMNSPDIMSKVAFLNLINACKKYHLEKMFNSDSENLEELKKEVINLRTDYKLIKNIS